MTVIVTETTCEVFCTSELSAIVGMILGIELVNSVEETEKIVADTCEDEGLVETASLELANDVTFGLKLPVVMVLDFIEEVMVVFFDLSF